MKESMNKILAKRENRIFISFIVIVLVLHIFSRLMLSILDIDFSFSNIDGSGIADGYIAVAEGVGFIFKFLGSMMYVILYFGLPLYAGIGALVSSIIARVVMIGEMKNWKPIISKIFNVIGVLPSVLMCLFILITLELAFLIDITGFLISLGSLVILIGLIVYILIQNFTKDTVTVVDSSKEIS